MNWKIKALFVCLSVFIATGCASITRPLDYSVQIYNKGKEMIEVTPFQITDGPVSTIEVGEVYPHNSKAMAPFYTSPFQNLIIFWRSSKTGAIGKAEVSLSLPKEFTKERGSEIKFYIFPE